MPGDRRPSSHKYRSSPYTRCNTNAKEKPSKSSSSLPIGNEKEWEETRCCICMEHPHNAVLLLCSSREKGCLPYICDTSTRHSNCLDQFQKTFMNDEGEQTKLVCPLCRGQLDKWTVVKPAREFMNRKTRSCSMGTCDFSGNYSQLREHARREHPCARPTDVDPERELEWSKFEREMEQQDMMSMQFEFDSDDEDDDALEIMDGFYELASPIWDPDLDMVNFFTAFESEFGSIFPELDFAADHSGLHLDDWDNTFNLSSSHESEIEEFGRSRGLISTRNRLSGMPRSRTITHGSGETSSSHESEIEVSGRSRGISTHNRLSGMPRSRTNTHGSGGPRSNSRPSSHNREEQVTTLVDFHELRSNMP